MMSSGSELNLEKDRVMEQMETKRPNRVAGWLGTHWLTIVISAVAAVAGLGTVFAWSASSPAGSSPDEDFHIASIWCPTPLGRFCDTQTEADGEVDVSIPMQAAYAACYAFQPDTSGWCTLQIADGSFYTPRVDNGLYPGGFYDVMHTMTGPDVYTSIIVMRVVNGILAILLFGALALVLPRSGQRLMAYATLPVCIPMMIYVVCSINPSGWAVTGVATAWFGMYAFFAATSKPRLIASGLIALVGAAMGSMARTDAGAYLMLGAVAMTILSFPAIRAKLWKAALPAAVLVIGVIGFFSGGQGGVLSGGMDMGSGMRGTKALLESNVLNLPHLLIDYTAGFIGLNWVDTVMPPLVWVTVAGLSLALLFRGLKSVNLRKFLAFAGLAGAYVCLPLYILQMGGDAVGSNVQPRYFVPLVPLVMAAAMWRPKKGGASSLSMLQTLILYASLVIAHAIALHVQIRRFVTGLDANWFNLNVRAEWWHAGPSPMATWWIGSVGFAVLALLLFRVRRDRTTVSETEVVPETKVLTEIEVPEAA